MPWKRVLGSCLVVTAMSVLGACDGSDTQPAAAPAPKPKRPLTETPCRDLRTRAAARRLALELDYLLIAPEREPRRSVVATLANSLYETCRQPRLPGVDDPRDYRPVRPVIAQIQRDYDEEEIAAH